MLKRVLRTPLQSSSGVPVRNQHAAISLQSLWQSLLEQRLLIIDVPGVSTARVEIGAAQCGAALLIYK